ncbi:MAG: hypothetical protein IKY18_09120 [Oscillospiraceae bacterium]|nr:hypothetical protein [Oscillospiraceae bacterium]
MISRWKRIVLNSVILLIVIGRIALEYFGHDFYASHQTAVYLVFLASFLLAVWLRYILMKCPFCDRKLGARLFFSFDRQLVCPYCNHEIHIK